MHTMKLIADEDLIDSKFGVISPFSLKKDLIDLFGKNYTDQQKQKIFRDIPVLIENGISKHVNRLKLGIDNPKVFVVKIRCKDERYSKGKSSGLRIIVLVDYIRDVLIPIHIYPKSTKENLTSSEEKQLKYFYSQYIIS